MSDINRRLLGVSAGLAALFTAFGAGLSLSLLLQPEFLRQASRSGTHDAANSPQANAQSVGVAPSPVNDRQLGTYDEAYYDSEHFRAQKIIAWWTRIMGFAAAIGLFLGGISIWLIFTTFRETRRAANAGFRANEIAEETAEAQLRPVMAFDRFVVSPMGDRFNWQCFWKNVGKSPARIMDSTTKRILTPIPNREPMNPIFGELVQSDERGKGRIVPSGEFYQTDIRFIHPQDVGQKIYEALAEIRYDSAFSPKTDGKYWSEVTCRLLPVIGGEHNRHATDQFIADLTAIIDAHFPVDEHTTRMR